MNYEEAIKSIKKSEEEINELKQGLTIDCGNFGDPVDEEQYDGGEF